MSKRIKCIEEYRNKTAKKVSLFLREVNEINFRKGFPLGTENLPVFSKMKERKIKLSFFFSVLFCLIEIKSFQTVEVKRINR